MVRHPALGNAGDEEPSISSEFGLLQGALRTEEGDLIDLIGAGFRNPSSTPES